jgi:hypothetical protein
MPIWGTVQNLEEAVIRLPPTASAALETRPSPDPSPGVSTAPPSGRRWSVHRRCVRKLTSSPAKRGTTECWATKARRNRHRRGAMPPECWVRVSRSAVPRVRHAPDRGAGYRAEAEEDSDLRAGARHALQRLLGASGVSVQAEPSRGAQPSGTYRRLQRRRRWALITVGRLQLAPMSALKRITDSSRTSHHARKVP